MRRALILLLPLLCGCYYFRSASVPMPYVEHPATAGEADKLIVLLPGLGDGPEAYERHGFVQHIQATDPRADVIAADAHLAYYPSKTIVQRLHEDVFAPRADRYREVWLVGISLGGLGCAAYAREHSEVVDRVLLLAPYLGTEDVYEQVLAAGGLQRWTPPDTADMSDEHRRYVWTWQWYRERAQAAAEGPAIYLGYGLDDRFRVPNGMLAGSLPEERCFTQPGGHTWTVWRPLFERMLTRALTDAR